jgi:membrane protein implicated in regulation of membrane protease activity
MRGVRWRAVSALAAALLVIGGFVLLLWLDSGTALAARLLGLPRALGIMVWVVAVAPLVVLGLLFGLAFADRRPDDDRVARLRRLAERGDHDG